MQLAQLLHKLLLGFKGVFQRYWWGLEAGCGGGGELEGLELLVQGTVLFKEYLIL